MPPTQQLLASSTGRAVQNGTLQTRVAHPAHWQRRAALYRRNVQLVKAASDEQRPKIELSIDRESSVLQGLNYRAGPKVASATGLLPGRVIGGKYTIQSVLGQGSNATTYKALAPDGTEVAVKALGLKGAGGWKQLELFQREAQTLSALSHPGIPRYLEYFEEDTDTDRSFYLVQELVNGKSLGEMVQAGQRADEKEVERVAKEVLQVLEYLGSLRPPVVHRDVKPENIVLQGGVRGGRVFLVDFGGVQALNAPVGKEGFPLGSTVIGTYGYMAPEQFQGGAQPASDVYALGGTLLFMLSGRPPSAFPQERMRVAWKGNVEASRKLQQLLEGMLEPVAEDRLSAADALAVLEGRSLLPPAAISTAGSSKPGKAARSSQLAVTQKPKGSRVVVTSTATSLDIDIPPAGLTGNTVATGGFALAWNAFVAFWTFSAAASGAVIMALFSAPFWWAGAQLMSQTVAAGLLRERFEVGRSRFKLTKEIAMLEGNSPKWLVHSLGGDRAREGESGQLLGARVVTLAIVNGSPRTAIEVVEGVERLQFGDGLQTVEQEYVAGQINAWLEQARNQPVDMDALPAPEQPKVFWDNDRPFSADDQLLDGRRWDDDSLESRFRK